MGTDRGIPEALFRSLVQARPARRGASILELADRLAVTPVLITELLTRWQAEGLPIEGLAFEGDIHATPRLAPSFEPLDRRRIRKALAPQARTWQRLLECRAEVDSTNEVLLDRARRGSIDGHLCLAEHQRAGRGRHGRRWSMPWGAGLLMSLGFDPERGSTMPPACPGIAAGIAAVRAIRRAGLDAAGLKWPNDIVFQDRKLGGILVETRMGSGAPIIGALVIGIGINMAWPPGLTHEVGQPYTDLRAALGREVSRNALAALVVSAAIDAFRTAGDHGFEALHAEWLEYERVIGRPVLVSTPEGVVSGEARGLDPSGALVVATGGALRRFHSGEVSLRLAP